MARLSLRLARRSLLHLGLVAASLSAIIPASAFTDSEIQEVFRKLDTNGDGKVTRQEYAANKVMIVYRNVPTSNTTLTFEDTRVSRAFFDAADKHHDGKLTPVEIMDALPFEAVDADHKNYITLDDLRRFMNKIGR